MRKLLFIILILLFASPVYATDYYLHPSGDDGNSGTSAGSANSWLTLAYACGQLSSSDTLYVQGGTYTSTSDYCDPTNGVDSVTITNYQSETPIFRSVGSATPYGGEKVIFYLSNNASWLIEGLEFIPTSSTAGKFFAVLDTGSDYNTFKDLTVTSNTDSGNYTFSTAIFRVVGGDYNEWDNVTLNGAGDLGGTPGSDGNLIIITAGNDYNRIHDSTFSRGVHDCIRIDSNYNEIYDNTFTDSDGYAVYFMNDAQCNLVHGNTASGADYTYQSGKVEYYNISSDYTIWRYNVAFNSGNHAMDIQGNSDNVRIYNNTFYGNDRDGVKWSASGSTIDGVRFFNNVVAHNMEGGWGTGYDGEMADVQTGGPLYTTARSGKLENNYIVSYVSSWQNDYTNIYVEGLSQSRYKVGTYMEVNYSSIWQNNIYNYSDPKFVDPDSASPDFSIQSGSSLIDQGRWLTKANGANTDNSLEVDDAGFFWYSAISSVGDQIAINTTASGIVYRTITAINYSTNVLTLGSSVTCSDDDKVTLYKSFSDSMIVLLAGSNPDIGMDEHEPTGSPLQGIVIQGDN